MKNLKKQLGESLHELKKIVWPHLSAADVIKFMKFSPTWSAQMERAEIEVELTGEQHSALIQRLDTAYKSILNLSDFDPVRDREPIVKVQAAQQGDGEITFNGDKKLIDQFMAVGANFKLDKTAKRIADDRVVVGGSEEHQKKAFTLFRAMAADDGAAQEMADLSAKVVRLIQRIKDKSVTPDEKKQITADMKSIGAELKSKLDAAVRSELTPEEESEFKEAHAESTGPAKYKITGYFAPVCLAYAFRRSTPHYSNLYDEPGSDTRSFFAPEELLRAEDKNAFMESVRLAGDIDELTRGIVKICDNEMARSSAASQDALRKNIEFEENKLRGAGLSPEDRAKSELALANYRRDLEKRVFRSSDALAAYMSGINIGFMMRLYRARLERGRSEIKRITGAIAAREQLKKRLADREKELADTKDADRLRDIRMDIQAGRDEIQRLSGIIPSDAEGNTAYDEKAEREKLPADVMSFETLDSLENAVGKTQERLEEQPSTDPNLATSCAKRRMKLFAAAGKRGAAVYRCADWVLAAITNASQAVPFGRYRPKCDSGGNIIEECNLEDWEGITPANKRRRDSAQGPYVVDGLWRQSYETRWCTSGWGHEDRRQWNNTAGPGNMFGSSYLYRGGMIVFMDCKTGYLYQYGNGTLLDECDQTGGILSGLGGGMQTLMLKYPSLAKALAASGFSTYIKPSDRATTPEENMRILMHSGRLTPSGSVLVNSAEEFTNIVPIINLIDEIKLGPDFNGVGFSTALNAIGNSKEPITMPIIDLGNISDGSGMFSNIILRNSPLRLKNTGRLRNAVGMFERLQFAAPDAEIAGLDTKNVIYADRIFAGCRSVQDRGVRIPALDLSQCSTMNQAFNSSGIIKITFKGSPDNVISAVDAFQNCTKLETVPNALFKSIKFGKNLISDFNNKNYADIFLNCPKLIKKYRSQPAKDGTGDKFDDIIDAIRDFYEDTSRLTPILDSRGYIKVQTAQDATDAAQYILDRRDVKGIVIDKTAETKYLFNKIQNLRIKSLDLNGVECTEYMFFKCRIAEFGEIKGSENVVDAACMFYGTACGEYPKMKFPKCAKMNVFKGAQAPDSIPDIRYSPAFDEIPGCGLSAIGDNGPSPETANEITEYMFGDTKTDWRNKHSARRLAEIMYISPLRSSVEDTINAIRKDKRGFAVIDKTTTAKIIQTYLERTSDIAGFVFDPELVAEINDNGYAVYNEYEKKHNYFENISVTRMPVIDFNGLNNCTAMFRNCRVGSFAGFEGSDSITLADGMFEGAQVDAALPEIDTKNITTASGMFKNARLRGGFERPLDLRSAQVTREMFTGCVTSDFPFQPDVVLPEARDAYAMFHTMQINGRHAINKIAAPKCKRARALFYACEWLTSVQSVEIGTEQPDASPDMAQGMFYGCEELKTVGNIYMPHAPSAAQMFKNCRQLQRVGVVDIPEATDLREMFENDAHLLNVCHFKVSSSASGNSMFRNTELGTRLYGNDGTALFARIRLLAGR